MKIVRNSFFYLLILLTLGLVLGCQSSHTVSEADKKTIKQAKSTQPEHSQKVIFLLVDSLMSEAIDQGIQQGELPALQFLIEHGYYEKDVVSSFPTMSVTIDSTLLTGTHPNEHRIPGLIWYSDEDKEIVNYGTGPMEIWRNEIEATLVDTLKKLNQQHLNPAVPTIHEELFKHGLKSGSINGLIYRGNTEHQLTIPAVLSGTTDLPHELTVKGPEYLALGSLKNPLKNIENLADGFTKRFGFNNEYAIDMTKYLIETNHLPDFLLVYLPDLDQKMHEDGPPALDGLKQVDQQVQSLLDAFGSPQKALEEAVFMIAGDSGMSRIFPGSERPNIDLPAILGNFNVLHPGQEVTDDTDAILAVNQTMAYVYKANKDLSLKELGLSIVDDPRIDFVSWKEQEWIQTVQGATGKQFRYKPDGPLVDMYGQKWTIDQQTEVLDIRTDYDHALHYGRYPDVLQRLYAALHSHQGEFLVVTAKPGYELLDRSSPTHEGGGGHGSLHEKESLIPLIVCGTEQRPEYLRVVDFKSYIVKLLTSPS